MQAPSGEGGRGPEEKPRMTMKSASNRAAAMTLALVLAAVGPATAAEATPLTLDAAIETAESANRRLAAADALERASALGAEEASSGWLPRIELQEEFSWTTNPVYVFGNLLGQEAFGPDNFDTDFLNEPDDLTNFRTRVVVTQPIYAGGKIGGNVGAFVAIAGDIVNFDGLPLPQYRRPSIGV